MNPNSDFRIPNSEFKTLSSFFLSAFRIPNSEFKTLSSDIYCDDVSFSVSKRAS